MVKLWKGPSTRSHLHALNTCSYRRLSFPLPKSQFLCGSGKSFFPSQEADISWLSALQRSSSRKEEPFFDPETSKWFCVRQPRHPSVFNSSTNSVVMVSLWPWRKSRFLKEIGAVSAGNSPLYLLGNEQLSGAIKQWFNTLYSLSAAWVIPRKLQPQSIPFITQRAQIPWHKLTAQDK